MGKMHLSKYSLSVGYGFDIEEGKKFYEEALVRLKSEFPGRRARHYLMSDWCNHISTYRTSSIRIWSN